MEMNIARLANEASLNAATRRDPADWQPLDIASISEPPKADAIHALDGVPESADASPPPPPPVSIDTDAAPVDADAVERTGEAAAAPRRTRPSTRRRSKRSRRSTPARSRSATRALFLRLRNLCVVRTSLY